MDVVATLLTVEQYKAADPVLACTLYEAQLRLYYSLLVGIVT
jgi:hypothetical protein